MKKLFVMWMISTISLWVVDSLFTNVHFDSFYALAMTALAINLFNATIKPVLKLIALPINFLTFGLFSVVINVFVFLLAFAFVSGSYIEGTMSILLVSALFAFIRSALSKVLKEW